MSEDHSIVDYEEVLRVLPESFLQSWKDNPDVLIYLSELGALGLQRLSQEPERLAEEKIGILEQTQDLAFHNYKTFIQAAECSQKIFQDFNIIESRLDALLHKLPQFKDKCSEFAKEAHQINARWHQASSTLAKHPQLLEFLEMPQLMDNYVRNGYYEEALELSSYVKRLERKHIDIPLIKSIVKDVQIAANTMLAHLLGKLRTNIQLPECLKVVGYLRRMDVFNETELRIKFLQARDSWFQKVISDIDKNDPYQHVIKVIESSRIHLFDIITQYRAIFSDEDPLLLLRENYRSNCAVFHSWITWKISWFLQVLENDLSANFTGRIDSVLAQCMYFGLSFSRVNIDFRPLLVPVFQNAVLHRYRSELENATFRFEKLMEGYSFSSYTNTMLLVPSLPENSIQPPNSLLDFYPLAHYCNDVLCSFNELRLCCSFSMSSTVTEILSKSLKRIVQTVVNIHSKKRRFMTDTENENFIKFCFLISTDLISHFNKCLITLFPPEDVSHVLGITSLEFKKVEHLCVLNSKNILDPITVILPTKDEEDDIGLTMNIKQSSPAEDKNMLVSDNENLGKNMQENIFMDSDEQHKNTELKSEDTNFEINDENTEVSKSKEVSDKEEEISVNEPIISNPQVGDRNNQNGSILQQEKVLEISKYDSEESNILEEIVDTKNS